METQPTKKCSGDQSPDRRVQTVYKPWRRMKKYTAKTHALMQNQLARHCLYLSARDNLIIAKKLFLNTNVLFHHSSFLLDVTWPKSKQLITHRHIVNSKKKKIVSCSWPRYFQKLRLCHEVAGVIRLDFSLMLSWRHELTKSERVASNFANLWRHGCYSETSKLVPPAASRHKHSRWNHSSSRNL